jgi:hypothetical protein
VRRDACCFAEATLSLFCSLISLQLISAIWVAFRWVSNYLNSLTVKQFLIRVVEGSDFARALVGVVPGILVEGGELVVAVFGLHGLRLGVEEFIY